MTKHHNKLVRDKIPEILEKQARKPTHISSPKKNT